MMPAMVSDSSEDSSVQRLEKRVNASWKALAKGRRQATSSRAKLVEALARKTSPDLSIVVFGSLARDEFTEGSDIDWTLLVDGLDTALENTGEQVQAEAPGRAVTVRRGIGSSLGESQGDQPRVSRWR